MGKTMSPREREIRTRIDCRERTARDTLAALVPICEDASSRGRHHVVVVAHLDQLNDARAKVGARSNRLETQSAQLQDMELNVKDILSKTEDVDMAKAMVDFSMHQAVYESALRSAARVLQPTLLDFLG